jgi:REP element-mobilizing transposase RayT
VYSIETLVSIEKKMREKEHIKRSHNVSLLLYHIVLPAKYRRKVFNEEVTKCLLEICEQIEELYEIYFLEIGSEADHVHFLIQGLPSMTVTRIVTILKSKSSNYLFQKC